MSKNAASVRILPDNADGLQGKGGIEGAEPDENIVRRTAGAGCLRKDDCKVLLPGQFVDDLDAVYDPIAGSRNAETLRHFYVPAFRGMADS
jgi:hypothetical protein